MQAAGIEVIPQAQLAAHPQYAKLAESGKPSPIEDEKSVGYGGWTYSARGLPITFDSDDEESFMVSSKDADPRGDHYRSMGNLLGGNSTSARWAEWNLAKGLDAHLQKVRVTVSMAFIETSGGLGAALGLLSAGQAEAEYRLKADPARYESEVLGAARATFAGFGLTLSQRVRR